MSNCTVENGLRKILPYSHQISCYVKGRWLDRTVLEVLVEEFRTKPKSHYEKQIQTGQIKVVRNGSNVLGDDLLELRIQNKDILKLTTHKHEPVVLDFGVEIPIIYNKDGLLVVNKPSSIPVHPTGKFYNNSLTEILKRQLNLAELHTCHRLDRLTSGLLVLTTNSMRASIIQKEIKEKTVLKQYLARVQGKFPDDITLNEPIRNIDSKLGFKNIKAKKEAITQFQLVKYNKELDQSIVLCQPLTGRTHQIRIHLNLLSHPIVNDPLYGPNSSQTRNEILREDIPTEEQFNQLLNEDLTKIENLKLQSQCEVCEEPLFEDPNPDTLKLWLHSYKYTFEDHILETEWPKWTDI